ncbi:MAG: AsmA family protein [Thiohalophilus sp.]|uniref:AsmA family protein n=1 Tax=Thiohalophilus sp. TaxID=3028392 RepID=UPI00287049A3|nr:AsmA family protein [Thiohalophilus sp.]MDR9435577.1 AsmA family protein [Thiohalophilus sp.]
MRAFFKIVLIILVAIVLLLLATIAVVTLVIDPNDYKDQISETVEAQTGRQLSIPGEINWSFFPWLGVELGEVRLGNAPGFEPETFAAVQQVEVRVRLWPLLFAELEVGQIILDGLDVTLQRNAAGVSNWDDLLQPAPAQAEPTPEPSQASGPPPLAALAVAGLEIRQARIVWDDRSSGQYFAVDPLNLSLGRVALATPVPLQADFRLQSRAPQMDGRGKLSLQFTAHLERQQLLLEDLQFQTDLNSPLLPGGQGEARLAAPRLHLDLARQTATAEALSLRSFDLRLQADIEASRILQAPRYQASVTLAPFSPQTLLQQLQIDLPPMADDEALSTAQLNAQISGDSQQATVSDLFVQFDESELSGELAVSNFTRPAITYALTLNQIDVDRYLPPATDTPATGANETPADQRKPVPATPASATAAAADLIPVEVIRPLDIDGTLRINRLKAMNLHSREIRITTRARDGRIRLHPLGAQLYEGNYSGDIRLDVTGNTPRMNLDESITGVQIGPLLQDLWGDDKLRGRTDLSLALSATGNDPQAIRQTLSGNTRFAVHEAEVRDIDMAQLQNVVNEIDNDLKAVINAGNLLEAKQRLDHIQQKFDNIKNPQADNASYFSEITGTVNIKNGLARNEDLQARLPFGRIRGEGTFDLVRLYSDYTAFIKLTSKGEVEQGKTYAQMDRTPFKIHFKGPLDELKPQPDFSDYLRSEGQKALDDIEEKAKAELKKKADEKVEEEKDKLKQKLEEKAGDMLKNLFK